MGEAITDKCYICNQHIETISHLYLNWPSSHLKYYLFEKIGLEIALNPLELLMGNCRDKPEEGTIELLQLLSVIPNNYIHSSKCKNRIL